MLKQEIILPGVKNARELGGYQAGDRTIRKDVFLRTASLDQISEEALQLLQQKYRVQTVVDFRMSDEQRLDPDPVIPGCENLPLRVIEISEVLKDDPSDEASALRKMFSDPNADKLQLFKTIIESGMIDDRVYAGFLLSEDGIGAYRAFFQAVLSLEEGRAILWHCTNGKDRTGCAAMLLLYALGASEETVYDDYLLTNEYFAEELEGLRKRLEPWHLSPEKLDQFLFLTRGVSRKYLENAQNALIGQFGSVEGYLSDALGIGEEERKLLRERFLVYYVEVNDEQEGN